MKQPPQVVCLGILVADVIGHPIEAAPPRGTLQLVDSIAPYIGGCAANTGIGLQTLGIATSVVGKVGRDGFGAFVRGELERYGATANVIEDETAPTSATMVLVSADAERSFLHCTGANATFRLIDFDTDTLDGATLLHIAGHGLMPRFDGADSAELLKIARAKGIKTSLDTAGALDDAWRANLRMCLPYLDIFVPSLHEVTGLFPGARTPEAIAAELLNAGVGLVGLKMGERGSFVTDGKQSFTVPPFSVHAVDATGAGDAFAAGFLAGVLHHLGLEECARLGNATGALCVTRTGTVDGYRSYEATNQFIQEQLQSS